MRVALIGDVVGRPGRRALHLWLQEHGKEIDLCIANGENAAGGFGLTEKITKALLSYGVDVITGGNHTFDKKEIFQFIDNYPILRPANYPEGTPGKGFITVEVKGLKVLVVNLMGRVFMECLDNPFKVFDKVVEENEADLVIVDFHGEASSEKQAFGFYADGRATAVYGTHTHVQTADLRLLPKGTLYITDLGMCGATDSVIGMEPAEGVERFVKQLPVRFKVPEKPKLIQLCGVVFEYDPQLKQITSFERIYKLYERREDGSYTGR
ncbi:TIGR00282 family metallophosphoesterase [Thermovibrio ammonificans]|uniref:Metallophosphoesterase n=1 Tax=Thermovibrio ammonificans (strain DSM 15698 / JCM 12110 / HB-1) TaxID=648996 RepID=E8T392_THEA1|nr:TIGR00282 family metallophosphoesterase [Thermovibrio ammonificans]ADU97224.1 metallophosphoesterase [Thermovibrio ammonificans HB-1]